MDVGGCTDIPKHESFAHVVESLGRYPHPDRSRWSEMVPLAIRCTANSTRAHVPSSSTFHVRYRFQFLLSLFPPLTSVTPSTSLPPSPLVLIPTMTSPPQFVHTPHMPLVTTQYHSSYLSSYLASPRCVQSVSCILRRLERAQLSPLLLHMQDR